MGGAAGEEEVRRPRPRDGSGGTGVMRGEGWTDARRPGRRGQRPRSTPLSQGGEGRRGNRRGRASAWSVHAAV